MNAITSNAVCTAENRGNPRAHAAEGPEKLADEPDFQVPPPKVERIPGTGNLVVMLEDAVRQDVGEVEDLLHLVRQHLDDLLGIVEVDMGALKDVGDRDDVHRQYVEVLQSIRTAERTLTNIAQSVEGMKIPVTIYVATPPNRGRAGGAQS